MRLHFILATVFLSVCFAAHADTVNFSYSGTDITGSGGSSTGTGTFSYAGSPSSLTLAGLTSFSFSQTIMVPSQTGSFSYSLANLSSFSATLTGDTLSTIMLATGSVASTNPYFFAESFTVTSLGSGGAYISNFLGGKLQSGQVIETSSSSTSPVPEPSTVALLGTGLLGLVGAARRRLS